MTEKEAKKRLESVMPSLDSTGNFQASSPPSVFIGSKDYPKVNTGILSPQRPGDPRLMDSPAQWFERDFSVKKIAQMRTSLVNSRKRIDAEDTGGFLESTQEIAMARKPVDVEFSLEKKPSRNIDAGRVKPVSASGKVEDYRLDENPTVDRNLEKAFYDHDWKAENAVKTLYSRGVDSYSLQQTLSTGMIGEVENRRLVPTRWSITAVDDMVSGHLRKQVKDLMELGQIEYYRNEYIGNTFHIFLLPGKWEYELVELKRPGSTWNAASRTYIPSNYEGYGGRTDYAEETAGAYYAARLGVLEHLAERGRQAKVLIVRDVKPEYWAPLGVWVIRETVRNGFDDVFKLESFEDVHWKLSHELKFLYGRIKEKSRLLGSRQFSLKDF